MPNQRELNRALGMAQVQGPDIAVSEDELIEAGAILIRQWHEVKESRTATLKHLASIFIKIRARYTDSTGRPDWAGHSWEYRQTITGMYDRSGVPPDVIRNIQASIRFHIGNLLREWVPSDELEDVGLLPTSPRARFQTARQQMAQLRDAMSAVNMPPGTGARTVRSLTAARTALDLALTDMENLKPEDLAEASVVLSEVIRLVDEAAVILRDVANGTR